MDKLEKYILQHREQLDRHTPKTVSYGQFEKLMADDLENFVRANRSSLDTESPSSTLWDRLAPQLPELSSFEDSLQHFTKDLDIHEPDDALWENITSELDQPVAQPKEAKTVSLNMLWKSVAAAVVAGLMLGIGFQYSWNASTQQDIASEVVLPELQEAERHYTSLISLKKQEVMAFKSADADMLKDFDKELNTLDSAYNQLKDELSSTQQQGILIEALVENLQLRIALLNKQIFILQSINKNGKVEQDETINL
ncbi:hypothetical protein V6R21_10745 [Limibacter armeniacum]|uniref:hypothetical protein n=1 Tax=Limibacter armeniacum TaxID=466084 RepID=UPI002FE5E40F